MTPFCPRWQRIVWTALWNDIIVYGVDTDVSPYDSGSYASSITYVTGMATVKACQTLVDKMKAYGAEKTGLLCG